MYAMMSQSIRAEYVHPLMVEGCTTKTESKVNVLSDGLVAVLNKALNIPSLEVREAIVERAIDALIIDIEEGLHALRRLGVIK